MSKERRAPGDGSIRVLPSGKIEFTVSHEYPDGTRARKRFYGETQKDAKDKYRKWLTENQKPEETSDTFEYRVNTWYKLYKEPNISPGSAHNYNLYIGHLIEAFGVKKFASIKPYDIQAFYAANNKKSKSAINYYTIVLRAVFRLAEKSGDIRRNPMDSVEVTVPEEKEAKAFSKNDVEEIIQYAEKDPFGFAILTALYTGMRPGELAGLMWSDIDFKNQIITIRRTTGRVEGGYGIREQTKTKRIRQVVIFPDLVEVLKSQYQTESNIGYVLHDRNGKWLSPDQLRRRYEAFFRRLNKRLADEGKQAVKIMSPHKCRHTFGTYLIAGGANIRAVQNMLGHASLSTTQKYTHVDIEEGRRNITKLAY